MTDSATHADTAPAGLLVVNGRLWSGGAALPHTALAARDGVIVALGGDELRDLPARRVLDARGGLVTPGFVDAHAHVGMGGIESIRCDLSAAADADEAIATVAAYAAAHPETEWILGGGWHMPHFAGGTPRREQLDAVVPDRPVFLLNADHHGAWVNTRALELAGVDASTPDPADGRIERDPDGSPSGTLHEGAADLVGRVVAAASAEELRAGILAGQERMLRHGVTAWQEAILGEYSGYPDMTPQFAELADAGMLIAQVSGALWVDRGFAGLDAPSYAEALLARRDEHERPGFALRTAKIMVDGVPENRTAAMEEPYGCDCTGGPAGDHGDDPDDRGIAYFSREELQELVPLLNAAGIAAHLHAIGDRAVRYALDAVEAVPAAQRVRNHIAHLQIVDPRDVPRFAELGVAANMQALWACTDAQMEALTLPLLGERRAGWQYPFASIARTGAPLACGSDWPVSSPDPWAAMEVAVTRVEPGEDAAPLLPEEALPLATVLAAYTAGSARTIGVEGGELAIGARCDLAIADRDPFAAPASEIHLTRNAATVVAGEVVFEAR